MEAEKGKLRVASLRPGEAGAGPRSPRRSVAFPAQLQTQTSFADGGGERRGEVREREKQQENQRIGTGRDTPTKRGLKTGFLNYFI